MKAAGLAFAYQCTDGAAGDTGTDPIEGRTKHQEDGPRRHLSKAGTPTMGDNHHHCRAFFVTDSRAESGSGNPCAGNRSFWSDWFLG